MVFQDVWPYISWDIKNVCNFNWSFSGDIFVKGYRLFLILKKKYHKNAVDDCLEMHLINTELELEDPCSFMVSVYLKDILGKNHFIQKSCIVCNKHIKRIWRVTLYDLFENTSLNLKTNLDFVCMFGPESEYQQTIGEGACEASNLCSCKIHLEKLSLDLSRLLLHGSSGDVILRCEGKSFTAHKSILSVRSPTFETLFENENFDVEFPSEVNICNTDFASLGHLLVFLYSGKVLFYHQTVDDAVQLYEAALKYQVPGLKEECMKFLVENLKEDSACRLLLFASEKNDEVFTNHIISFISKNELLKSKCWAEFSYEHPELAIRTYYLLLENDILRRSQLPSVHKVL